MGLGSSIKMTTLHHFFCPTTRIITSDPEVELTGIIVDGVSELCEDKIYTAKRTADLAKAMRIDGALVAIDGWGNHHIDFVNVIKELGMKGIPSVGLSYIGMQGRLVCSNPYVDCVIDFNKSESGYESCRVGENNLTEDDAFKALGLLKYKMKKAGKCFRTGENRPPRTLGRLVQNVYRVEHLVFGEKTSFEKGRLIIRRGIEEKYAAMTPYIEKISLQIISPEAHQIFVNANLDFFPVACKVAGELGEGITSLLSGLKVMLTGVEAGSGYQPANIGSSEGILKEQVKFDEAGTPESTDFLLHIDVTFKEGEGRTARGIRAAHKAADQIVQEIREAVKKLKEPPVTSQEYLDVERPGKAKTALIKIVSGLGNMYDTALFPNEPGGFTGAHSMMATGNLPYVITANQCRDGVIHSLI